MEKLKAKFKEFWKKQKESRRLYRYKRSEEVTPNLNEEFDRQFELAECRHNQNKEKKDETIQVSKEPEEDIEKPSEIKYKAFGTKKSKVPEVKYKESKKKDEKLGDKFKKYIQSVEVPGLKYKKCAKKFRFKCKVKRAKYIGVQAFNFNTYVTLKLQNVKSTTVTVKGQEPCWEQDFLFETNNVNSGLLVEVWNKGMIWDRALGYKLIPLETISYNIIDEDEPEDDFDDCDSPRSQAKQQLIPSKNEVTYRLPNFNPDVKGKWYPLDMELVLRDGTVAGTKTPTGHKILLDCRFELPFDPDNHPGDLQRKLELLNGIMTNDRQQRHAQYLGNSGYSEDSDYTSDLNYPVGQNANSSASQYRNLRTPPQHSLETSRENSYERDDRRSPYYDSFNNIHNDDGNRDNKHSNMTYYSSTEYCYKDENDPLSYNSRPMSSLNYIKSVYSNGSGSTQSVTRMRSLERQGTFCDSYGSYQMDPYNKDYRNYDAFDSGDHARMDVEKIQMTDADSQDYNFQDSLISDNLSEDRQWDSGGRGTSMNQKILPKIPIKHSSSMVDGIYYNRGASLPPTPLGPKRSRLLPLPNAAAGTMSPVSGKSRMLPQPKVGSKRMLMPILKRSDTDQSDSSDYYLDQQFGESKQTTMISICSSRPLASASASTYNEDYNYAYNSSDSINLDGLTGANTPTSTIASRSSGRRKGATLPSVPKLSSGYNSQSFENDYLPTMPNTYLNDSVSLAGDDYAFESNQIRSKKAKKLPVPITTAAPYSSSTTLSSKLPTIPYTTSTTPAKMLPVTPMVNSSYYDESFSNYGRNEDDSYSTDFTVEDIAMTTSQPTYTSSNYLYKSVTSSANDMYNSESLKSTTSGSSMFGTLTTGFKATISAVGGSSVLETSSASYTTTSTKSSTTAASLTSTAKSYLGLASKFLPNLSGGSNQASSMAATPTTTTVVSSSVTNSLYSDYYTRNSSSFDGQTYPYGMDTVSASSTTMTSSIYKPKTAGAGDPYSTKYYNGEEGLGEGKTSLYHGNLYDTKYNKITSVYGSTNGEAVSPYLANDDKYDTTKIGSSSTEHQSQLASTTSVVDYSDYKYGYDEYSCNENDYIATGDITDKKLYNYNNNYDTYDDMVTTTSTTATIADSTINIEATKPSSLNYDYNYSSLNSGNVNKNSVYCDNSYNVTGSIVSPSVTAASIQSTATSFSHSVHLSSMYTPTSPSSTKIDNNLVGTPTQTVAPLQSPSSKIVSSTAGLNRYSMDQPLSQLSSSTASTAQSNALTSKLSYSSNNNTFVPTSSSGITTTTKENGRGTSLLLMKQQPTELYEDEEPEADLGPLDYVNGHHVEEDDYYMHTSPAAAVPPITEYNNATDTPYYDYRNDFFNEEDEYKYLENEMNEQQKHQDEFHQFHKKQPPLEYIEESHDDYMHDELNDNKAPIASCSTSPTIIPGLVPAHPHKLLSQESISDDTIQQQHLALKKQDSIQELEEEEEKIPSPRDHFSFDSKETPSVSKALMQAQQQSQLTNGIVSTTASGVGMGIGGGASIAGIICDVENDSFKKKASLTRGETEEVTSGQLKSSIRKPEVTAKQRWHWAYNKIIMQLNLRNPKYVFKTKYASSALRLYFKN